MKVNRRQAIRITAGLFTGAVFARAGAVKAPELIWREPTAAADILRYGPTGPERQPEPPFRFEEEDAGGSNPKIKVRDARGDLWIVKWGDEVHSESFASRLTACAGYFVRPAIFASNGEIEGVRDLGRAKGYIDSDGRFNQAVMKLIQLDRPYSVRNNWSWRNNPFLADGEGFERLNGLKVMMMLTSNWDNKDARQLFRGVNTAIYEERTPALAAYLYAFDDWGATMGRWGGVLGRSKWDAAGYLGQTKDFVLGVDHDGFIKWGFDGKAESDLKSRIRPSDVAALMHSLQRIEPRDLVAGLETCGAEPEEIRMYAEAIQMRIDQLKRVAA